MALTDAQEFTEYNTFSNTGIVTSDTFNSWRKKTNGMINEIDRVSNLITSNIITPDELSLGAPTWTTGGALSTYNNGAGTFNASSITGTSLKVGGSADAATGAVNALSLAVGTSNTQFTVSSAGAIVGSSLRAGSLTSNAGAPSVILQDTDGRSSILQANNNTFYVLRGSGINSTTWETLNGQHPLEINLETNGSTFGGTIVSGSTGNPTGKLTAWKNAQTNVASSGIVSASVTGNSTIALDCSGSSGAMIRHVRGGSGVEIVDNTTTPGYANLRSSRLIVSSTNESLAVPSSGGINLQGAGGNNYIFGTLLDGASNTLANIKINSWHGIGFGPTITGQTIPSGENAVYIDCRNGNLTARGTVTAATPTAPTHVTTKAYVDKFNPPWTYSLETANINPRQSTDVKVEDTADGDPSTGTGYLIDNPTTYPIGTTTLHVDTGTGSILAGSLISIGSIVYRVVTGFAGNGDGDITIAAPGLRAAVTNNTAVTIYFDVNSWPWTRVLNGEYYEYTITYPNSFEYRNACSLLTTNHWIPAAITNFLYRSIYKIIAVNHDPLVRSITFQARNSNFPFGYNNPNIGTGNYGSAFPAFGIIQDYNLNRFLILHSDNRFGENADDGTLCFVNLLEDYKLPGNDWNKLSIRTDNGNYADGTCIGLLKSNKRQNEFLGSGDNTNSDWFNNSNPLKTESYADTVSEDNFSLTRYTIPIGLNTATRVALMQIKYYT